MNENIIVEAKQYDYIDGRNAYKSKVKKLTLGEPTLEDNKNMKIAAQVWEENELGELKISMEIPIHQIMDLMIFLSQTLLHFREAYRLPLLYDPKNPSIGRVGMQGGVMPVSICTENENINEDIKVFSQSISDLGEILGERMNIISNIIEEMR